MPRVRSYENQYQLGGTTGARFDAANYGPGVGPAIKLVGETLGREAEVRVVEAERERQVERTRLTVEAFNLQQRINSRVLGARDNAADGAVGHVEGVRGIVNEEQLPFLQAINDPVLRTEFSGRVAAISTGVMMQEEQFASRERTRSIETNSLLAIDRGANSVLTTPTPENYENVRADLLGTITLLTNVPQDTRDALRRRVQQGTASAYINGIARENPAAALETLRSGIFDRDLTADQRRSLEDNMEVQVRVVEADRRRVLAEQESQAREEVQLFNARLAAGDQPTDEEFDRISGLARQYSWGADLFRNEERRAQLSLNRETRNWAPTDWDREINRLQAKEERSTDENVRLTQLRQLRTARVGEYNNDPQGAAARGGNPAPGVDWANPTRQQLNARAVWAEGYARQHRLAIPPYLSEAEIAPLRQAVGTGTAGTLQVAQQVRQQWGPRGAAVVRQIAPNNSKLRLAYLLPQTSSTLYLQGLTALERNGDLFDQEAARRVFQEVQEAIPTDMRDAVWQASRAIVAGNLDADNASAWTEDAYRTALHLAMGARGLSDGNLSGGLGWHRGEYIWLPPSITQADAERRIARASGEQFVRAAGGRGAYFTNTNGTRGRTVYSGEIRQMVFETIEPGVYRVRGPVGGYLVNERGQVWTFDIRRLP